jgi:hypothetical protein
MAPPSSRRDKQMGPIASGGTACRMHLRWESRDAKFDPKRLREDFNPALQASAMTEDAIADLKKGVWLHTTLKSLFGAGLEM